jgi:hypothetical protein
MRIQPPGLTIGYKLTVPVNENGFSLTGSVSLYPYCQIGRLDSHLPVLLVYIHIVRPGGWILINRFC